MKEKENRTVPFSLLGWPGCLRSMPEDELKEFLHAKREVPQEALEKLNNTVVFFKAYRERITKPLSFSIKGGKRINGTKIDDWKC